MANTTVYPYGVGGQLPSSIGIVNDLKTGGADKALAAEQGKALSIKFDGAVGNYILNQFSANRLATDVFFASEFSDFAKMWLSDDSTFECTLFASNSNNQSAGTQIVGWGGTKAAVQSAILSLNYAYAWLFVREKNNENLSPSDVWLVGQFLGDVEQLQGDVSGLQNDVEQLHEIVEAKTEITIEIGSWYKNPTTAGVPGVFAKTTQSTNRLRSDVYYINNGETVSAICKDGYECNLYYLNPATGSEYVTGWNALQSAKKSISEYTQFVATFRRSDDATVSSSDLDCVESFVINSEFTELQEDVAELKEEVFGKYADRPSSGYEEFTVSVDTSAPDTDGTALSLQDTQTFENDKGKIYLPTSYSATGNPTRLIIHCHGASQNYNNGTVFPKASSLVTIDYLLAKGYAVMDVNGLPGTHSFYATTCGNPVAYRSYLTAYKWAVTKYNLHKDIFVIGISAGSVPALQISQIETIPVLACVTYCGIMDFSRGWMLLGGYHPNSQGPNIKGYLADKFAFTGTRPTLGNIDPCSDAEWEYVVSNWAKFSGWNPFTMGISSTITREDYRTIVSAVYGAEVPDWINADYSFESVQKMLLSFKIPQRGDLSAYQTAIDQEQKLFDTCSVHRKVPLKMFHATNDDVAPYRYSKYFYEMCKRGGSTVEFRTFASGGHNPTGDTQNVTVGGVSITTNTLSLEVLDWLQRFE